MNAKKRCSKTGNFALKCALFGLLGLLLCACQSSRSLGERAIVKAIYLDVAEDGTTQAALAVFTCTPNSDTADVEGEARIYCGQGAGVEEALYQAERRQNKKPFYAQNELLLLGPGAVETDVTPYLRYFGQEDSARSNLGVFVTPLTVQEFADCEESIRAVVQEGERLLDVQADGMQPVRNLSEIQTEEQSVQGWLPVLCFSAQDDYIGVQSLLLLDEGKAGGAIQEDAVSLALLLANKNSTLSLHPQIEGRQLSCETQRLRVEKSAQIRGGVPCLTVTVRGRVRQISDDGMVLRGEEARQAVDALNTWIEQQFARLNDNTFRRGNDVFNWAWWLRMCDANMVRDMVQTGDLFNLDCVQLHSALTVAA